MWFGAGGGGYLQVLLGGPAGGACWLMGGEGELNLRTCCTGKTVTMVRQLGGSGGIKRPIV